MTPAEEKDLRFHAAIGRCIAQWSHIEDELYRVYEIATVSKYPAASKAAFYAVISPEIKLAMTHSAVSMRLRNDSLLNVWKTIYNQTARRRKLRNNIAHFQIMLNDVRYSSPLEYELRPMIFDPNNLLKYGQDLNKGYPVYQLRDLESFARSFGFLSWHLRLFAYRLGRHLGQLELDPLLENDLRQAPPPLGAHSSTGSAPPPQSSPP